MIRTDGIPTIACPPARVQADVVPSGILRSEDALCERNASGMLVELHRLGTRTIVRVQDGGGDRTAIVPDSCALDAFEHPYAYLPR